VAFHRGTDLGVPIKKVEARDAPDVEEAFDVCQQLSFALSSFLFLQIDDEIPDDEEDIKPKAKDTGINDKLIKEKKPKEKAGKSKAK